MFSVNVLFDVCWLVMQIISNPGFAGSFDNTLQLMRINQKHMNHYLKVVQ